MITYSKKYINKKKKNYDKLISDSLIKISNTNFIDKIYEIGSDKLIEYVDSLSEIEILTISNLSLEKLEEKLEKEFLLPDIQRISKIRFIGVLNKAWKDSLELGVLDTIYDLFYSSSLIRNEVNTELNSFGFNLDLAEFSKKETDKKTKLDKNKIARSKANLTNLRNNIYKLKQDGILPSDTEIDEDDKKISQTNLKQRIVFLDTIQNVSNFDRKSEVANKTFLQSYYLRQRQTVLSEDYSKSADKAIKRDIAKYLNKNIEGINQIKSRDKNATITRQKISKTLQKEGLFQDTADAKARLILRTEINLGYNFGKLSGFLSPEDRDRKMQWRADFEMERKFKGKGYEVCDYCEKMNGTVYTVDELLQNGISADAGILNYRNNQTKTTFKHPTKPVLPAHPSCGCFWIFIQDDDVDENRIKESQEFIRDNLPLAIGAGLILTGSFLLARSNVWKAFLSSSNAYNTYQKAEEFSDATRDAVKVGRKIDLDIGKMLKKVLQTDI